MEETQFKKPEKEKNSLIKTLSFPSSSSPSYKASTFMASLTSSSNSNLIGEYIGIESCLDFVKTEDGSGEKEPALCSYGGEAGSRRKNQRSGLNQEKKRREFPPPIPSLARTENLQCHMPWVLRRHYTNDGRLILTEEKVKHHEYFRANRCNGRLTLQLVPLDEDDDVVSDSPNHGVVSSEEQEDQEMEEEEEEEGVNGDEVEEEEMDQKVPTLENGIASKNNVKCLGYNDHLRQTSGCIFGVPMPAMRPVKS